MDNLENVLGLLLRHGHQSRSDRTDRFARRRSRVSPTNPVTNQLVGRRSGGESGPTRETATVLDSV